MDRGRGGSFQSIKPLLFCLFEDRGLKFLLQNLIRPIVVKFFLRDRKDTCQAIMSVMIRNVFFVLRVYALNPHVS